MTVDTGTPVRTAVIDASPMRVAGAGIARLFLPIALALVVGAIVLLATGNDPVSIYGLLVQQSFGSIPNLDATLVAATPLLYTGIGAAFAYRAGAFSVGVEGSFVAGGLAAAVVGAPGLHLAPGVALGAPLVAGVIVGGLVGVVPAILRAFWSVDEVVTTLMMNFIVAGLANWLVVGYLQQRGQGNTATATVASGAQLGHFGDTALTNWGGVIAVALLVAYWLFLQRSALGFEFRAVGSAPRFAIAQGIRVRLVLVVAIIGAGAVGGLGGAAHTTGDVLRYTGGFSANYGFTGIAIALIARFNPVGILVGAVIFGALASAGTTVQLFENIPIQLVQILQGTVMMFAVVSVGVPTWLRSRRARASAVRA